MAIIGSVTVTVPPQIIGDHPIIAGKPGRDPVPAAFLIPTSVDKNHRRGFWITPLIFRQLEPLGREPIGALRRL
jgi:hypothetical protein